MAATDERQAGIVFRTAGRMVELEEALATRIQVYKDRLVVPERGASRASPTRSARCRWWSSATATVCSTTVSEIADLVPLVDGLNKSLADMLVTSEYAARPRRWATGIELEDDTGEADESETTDTETTQEEHADEAETFPRAYVERLRDENARYRTRAQRVDDLAARLHTALVAATGRLADPSDLPFDEGTSTPPTP